MTRRSKREIESRLDDLSGNYAKDYPKINFVVLSSAIEDGEYESIEGKPLARCHGQLYYQDPEFRNNLATAVEGASR